MSRRDFLTWAVAAGAAAVSGTALELGSHRKDGESDQSTETPSVENSAVKESVLAKKEHKETNKKFPFGAFLDEEIDRLSQSLNQQEKKKLLSGLASIQKKEKEKIYDRRFSKSEKQVEEYFSRFLELREELRGAFDNADPLKLIPRSVLCGMIGMESGGNNVVNKDTGAAGIWQINLITARHMGLKVDKTVDERMDLEKSSSAAVRYLLDLYERFGRQWGLALVAYAGGPGKLTERIRGHFKLDSKTDFTPDLFSKKNINAVTLYRKFHDQHSVQYPFGAQAMAGWIGELLKPKEKYESGEKSVLVNLC